jgi:FkbM family methyltransferase
MGLFEFDILLHRATGTEAIWLSAMVFPDLANQTSPNVSKAICMPVYVDRYRHPPGHAIFQIAARPALRDLATGHREKIRAIASLFRKRADIASGYGAFADKASKALFRDLLVYRYLSPHFSRVARNKTLAHELDAFMQEDYPSEPLSINVAAHGGSMMIWPVELNGAAAKIATTKYGLYWTMKSEQYFFRRGKTFVGPEEGDIILDCGALFGDTAIKFAAYAGNAGKVYSFDPVPRHVKIARESVARNQFEDRIAVFACGVSNNTTVHDLIDIDDRGLAGNEEIQPGHRLRAAEPTITIDDFCRRKSLQAVDYIKMDIEGSEAEALEGAADTIATFKPKLAICLYHKPSDLWTIPAELKRRYPFYKLFLQHYSLHLEETVMYAIADRSHA